MRGREFFVTSKFYLLARCANTCTFAILSVQHHLETDLMLSREGDWDGHAMPASVERDFRRYLECGILAYGFARAYCADCGRDFLVAFSCKGRGYAEYMNMLS